MDVARYETDVESYLERLSALLSAKRPSQRKCERLFEDFLAVAEVPSPDERLLSYFHTPGVLARLAESLHIPYSEALREAIVRTVPSTPRRHEATAYRIRSLSPIGRYPNLHLASQRAWYVIRHGSPYLVTLNSPAEDRKWGYGSELSDWTRHETRFATALSCTEWGGFALYLGRHGEDFGVDEVSHVGKADRLPFMIEWTSLIAQVHPEHAWPRERSRGPFEFYDFRLHRIRARRFAAAFLISHPLLLRTARYYLKASMLWRTDGLAEDALVNLMFALEGCLLLFQDIEGARTDRLDRKLLRRILARQYVGGDALYDFIEDAMGWGGTRAQLVHPQLSFSDGWTPFMMADDFYEYHELVRAVLTYIVTGTTYESYELAHGA